MASEPFTPSLVRISGQEKQSKINRKCTSPLSTASLQKKNQNKFRPQQCTQNSAL